MSDHPYDNQEVHGAYELFDLGPFPLEEGGTLRGCQLAYATVGELSAARDNAILLLPWYAGTSKRLGQAYVGPGRALDPGRYFIILVNQFGSGLSTSPPQHPSSLRQGPLPTGGHRRRRAGPGATRARAVRPGAAGAGGWRLDGGTAAYEWAVRFPDMVKRAAAIVGTAKITPHDLLYVETFSEAIRSDPAWRGDGMPRPRRCSLGCAGTPRVWGHLALLGLDPSYTEQVDRHLGELLDTTV